MTKTRPSNRPTNRPTDETNVQDTYKLAFLAAGKLPEYRQVAVDVRDAMREVPGHQYRFHHLGEGGLGWVDGMAGW